MARHVLVPYDGGEPSEAALSFALREHPADTITVLHVVEPFPDHTAAGVEDYSSDWESRAENIAETTFEQARSIAAEHDVDIHTEWEYGRPRHAIIDYLEGHPVDQVVMGSHNQGAVSRLILGSVAEAIVRRSPAPVTVVRERPDSA